MADSTTYYDHDSLFSLSQETIVHDSERKGDTAQKDTPFEEGEDLVPKKARRNDRLLPFVLVLIGVFLSLFAVALDYSSTGITMLYIGSYFKDASQAGSASALFILTSTTFQPMFGSLANIIGRKLTILSALTIFVIFGLLCSASTSMPFLIASRAFQGIGAGGVISLAYILIADLFPPHKRGCFQSILSAAWGIASVAGPLISGSLIDVGLWRHTFYVLSAMALLAGLLLALFLKTSEKKDTPLEVKDIERQHTSLAPTAAEGDLQKTTAETAAPPRSKKSFVQQLVRFDHIGTLLLCVASGSIVLALQWGSASASIGALFTWRSPLIISMLVGGVVFVGIFIVYEKRFRYQPVVPLGLFCQRNPSLVLLCHLSYGLAVFGMHFYLPMYFQVVKGHTAVQAGLDMIPDQLAGPVCYAITSVITTRTGYIRLFVYIGFALMAVGGGLLTLFDSSTPILQQVIALLLTGGPAGLIVENSMIIGQSTVQHASEVATATALCNFFRSLGGAFSIAIYSVIINHTMDAGLAGIDARYGYGIANHVQRDILAITRFPSGSQLKSELQQLYTSAIHHTSLMVICMSAFGFFVACFIGPVRLRRGEPHLEHKEENLSTTKSRLQTPPATAIAAASAARKAVVEEGDEKK
ncbi:major facilitator superfamily domain-containing protein [Syncephalastrum racemosum]|uniref:Major facilitator superfamily domain-containing protein n=1 Tax=Syncephalastrum racemosum TaxID=13706 RepID=A0A1X2H6B4_SYNRA|nr:major facilitator superfamily domain-containing protein [Syncephalastrum racemosum]